jgi:hypothetical protein
MCEKNLYNCKFIETNNTLVSELKKEILRKATIYKKQNSEKKSKNNLWNSKPKED